MNLKLSILRRPAAMASLLVALAVPTAGYSSDPSAPVGRRVAPVGSPIQQVNFNSCPNGDCNGGYGGGSGWGWGWGNRGGGYCSTCNGGGLFGQGCRHGLAMGQAWVRPPATWGLARSPNVYNYYWNAQLTGTPPGVVQAGVQYPMVYQPTDTAQMGFYYQSVPRWQYRPNMLPPAPAPYWPLGMNKAYGAGYGGGCPGGNCWAGSTVDSTNVVPNNGSPVNPAPVQNPQAAPPPPVEPQINVPEPEATFFPNRARR